MNVFISYNHQNSSFVLEVVEKLKNFNNQINVNKELFFDQDSLQAGQNWTKEIQEALESSDACIVFIGEQGIGNWQNKEVLTAVSKYDASRGEFKIIPVIIPHSKREQVNKNVPWFLADIQWIEFAHETDPDGFQKILDALINPDGIGDSPVNPETCPYKGLDFFDVQDAPFFFGRTFDVNWIFYKKLQLNSKIGSRFLAIIGDSGSGKSSFARAGVLANIKAGRFAGSETWKQVIFSPEDNPLLKLSTSLQSAGIIADAKKMEDDAKTDASTLRRMLEIYGSRIVLMIDQFEEVITQCKDNQQREIFLKNITEALKSQHMVCVITMRSDFYAAFSPFREFADLLETNNYIITSLDFNTSGEDWQRYLRAIIQKPAQLLNVRFEPILTTQIIEDCKAINGVLPALQLALVGLWKKRKGNATIDPADYDVLTNGKGISGIIETHANATWNALTRDGSDKHRESLIKAIFIRLVEITTSKEDVRKTVNKNILIDELRSQYKQDEVEEMLGILSGPDTRLIRIKKDETNKEIYWAEVIHEVLIRQWDMLRKWVNERRDAITYKNRLEQLIEDDNELLAGKKLASAEKWIRENKDLTTDKINDFVAKGRLRVKKRKNTLIISLAALVLLAIGAKMFYPVVQCKNCTLVKTVLKNGNYTDDEVRTLTLSSTNDILNLHCFKNLETLVLQGKTGEDYLSQASIDLLPRTLKQLTINNFFTNDTLLQFKTFPKLTTLKISTLKGLGKLSVAKLDSLTELALSGLENFEGLEGTDNLQNMETLTLSDLGSFSSLKGIKSENLKALNLTGLGKLSGLSGIESLKNLQTLALSRLPIDELSAIQNIKNLQTLKLEVLHNIKNLDAIKDLKGLQTLNLSGLPNLLNDIQGLENLQESLQTLSLDLHIDSLGVIENFKNLQNLDLSGLRISSIARLKSLEKLQSLSLSGLEKLSGLSGLENLKTLHSLTLRDLHIDDLAGIEGLYNLQELELSELRSLHTLSGLEHAKNLRSLTLSQLETDNLSALSNLHNLHTLSLDDLPRLSNLTAIENLKSLQTLTVSNLDIPDLSGIGKIKGLQKLSLSYLPEIKNLAGITEVKNLRTLSLSGLPFTNIQGIEKLTNIQLLYLDDIGKSTTVFIPALSIDTVIIFKVKLKSLKFLDNKRLTTFVYNNELELADRDKELSLLAKKMKQTRFLNLSVLRGPSDEGLSSGIML